MSAPVQHAPRASDPLTPAILFRDADLIAVHKPPGLPSQATPDLRRDDLVSAVARLLRASDPSAPAPLPVHRLDVETSGVTLLALHPDSAAALSRSLAARQATKTYLAIVQLAAGTRATAGDAWEVRNHLARPRRARDGARVRAVRSGGDLAHTRFRVLDLSGDVALVEARPLTGRMHQVRVHLADNGMPLLGDTRYGGPAVLRGAVIPRTMLHARGITLPHPARPEESLTVESPLPDDFAECMRLFGIQAVRASG